MPMSDSHHLRLLQQQYYYVMCRYQHVLYISSFDRYCVPEIILSTLRRSLYINKKTIFMRVCVSAIHNQVYGTSGSEIWYIII